MTAIVLLPGLDGTGDMFAGLAACLQPGLRPTVVSYPPDRPLCYAELEAYVRGRLPSGEPFILLAESFSGPVALRIAASPPSDLRALVLCCTFARAPVAAHRWLRHLVPVLPVGSNLIALAAPLLLGIDSRPALIGALRQALRPVHAAVLRARLKEVLGTDVSAVAARVTLPTLYLQARRDRIIAPSAWRNLSASIPHMRRAEVDGPHLLLQACPRRCADVIASFAGSIPG